MIKKEQEVWKTYPEFDFIEVSNLGRVRTTDRYVTCKNGVKRLYKSRVLKQQLNPNGYMYVSFRVGGKVVNLRVHRMVATCFIPNPNNYPEVNHIDNDRTNNAVSNLEWCTSQYNIDYKNNFGTSPAQAQGRPVFAVEIKTGKVLYFESQHEAARQLHLSQGSICSVLKGKLNQIGGYWFTEDNSEITKEKIQEIKANMNFLCGVIAINIETAEVLWFESQHEASRQLGIDARSINNVVRGRRNTTCGCWLCYSDSTAVEKTKAKFGDKIAKKVEKLIREYL